MIEELGAVVTVEALEFKDEALLNILDLFENSGGAVVPGGPAFGPSGVDVGQGQTPDKITGQRVSTVGDGIGLHESGLGDIPIVSANGDLGS